MIPATFEVPVEPIGTFTFRKRTMRDQLWIEAEGTRLVGAGNLSVRLVNAGTILASVQRLLVEAPPGWTLNPPIVQREVDAPGVGAFTFRSQAAADYLWIEAEAIRVTGGDHDSPGLMLFGRAFASMLRLTVKAPDGWDIEAADPLSPDDLDRITAVYNLLRASDAEASNRIVSDFLAVGRELAAAEARFRERSGSGSAPAGAGDAADDRVRVSPPIPAAGD